MVPERLTKPRARASSASDRADHCGTSSGLMGRNTPIELGASGSRFRPSRRTRPRRPEPWSPPVPGGPPHGSAACRLDDVVPDVGRREGVEKARRALPDRLLLPTSPEAVPHPSRACGIPSSKCAGAEQQAGCHSCRDRPEPRYRDAGPVRVDEGNPGEPPDRPSLPCRARPPLNPRLSQRGARAPKARRVSGVWWRTPVEWRPSKISFLKGGASTLPWTMWTLDAADPASSRRARHPRTRPGARSSPTTSTPQDAIPQVSLPVAARASRAISSLRWLARAAPIT